LQTPTPGNAPWTACFPATSGYAAPDGGSPWQEVQSGDVSGEPAWWHAVQGGAAETGETPVTAWHEEQLAAKLAGLVVM